LFRGRVAKFILNKYNPKSVLEIGPGAGFITRTILNNNPLHYVAVDIVKPFLDFCQDAISLDKNVSSECDFICGDISNLNLNKKFDIIFFLSTLHHIPDREEFINSLLLYCHKETLIISVEPTHYLLRIRQIINRLALYISNRYVKYNNYQNLSTHHFLTLNEYRSFSKFKVIENGFWFPKKVPAKLHNRYFSTEMYAVL
jgi:2-polyprenyl-3-methyl-5-hydroxy-6-metoxy-1,4-benzoquinol methylase